MLLAYHEYIRPEIEYGTTMLGSEYKRETAKLESVSAASQECLD